jgi:hypothetical protein
LALVHKKKTMSETLPSYQTHVKRETLRERIGLSERRKGLHRRTGGGIMALLSRMNVAHVRGERAAQPAMQQTPQSYEQHLVGLQQELRQTTSPSVVRGVARVEAPKPVANPIEMATPVRSGVPATPEVFVEPTTQIESEPAQLLTEEELIAQANDPSRMAEFLTGDTYFGPDGQPRPKSLPARAAGEHDNPAEDMAQMSQRQQDERGITRH